MTRMERRLQAQQRGFLRAYIAGVRDALKEARFRGVNIPKNLQQDIERELGIETTPEAPAHEKRED